MNQYNVTVNWLVGSRIGTQQTFEVQAYSLSIAENLVLAHCQQLYFIEMQQAYEGIVVEIVS